MLIAALPDAETAGNIATLLFSLTLTFNGKPIHLFILQQKRRYLIFPHIGVMQPPAALPGFWIFMYRVSPLTYLVSGITSTGIHARPVICASNELSRFDPPPNQTCGAYLADFLATKLGGTLINPSATTQCEYCQLGISDQFLASVGIEWDTRWRDYGIGFSYIFFNIGMAVVFYYVFRVRKWSAASVKKGPSELVHWLKEGGSWARTLLVGHGKKIPEGEEERTLPNTNRIY